MTSPHNVPPDRLETERLILRPYVLDDAPDYLEVCLRNRQHLIPYEIGNPAVHVETLQQAQALLQAFANDWAVRAGFFIGVWERTDGSFAAQIYLGPVSWELPEFEIGYFVDCAKEGRGFVSEAVEAVLAVAFDQFHAHRVSLQCDETNVRSWHVAERAGFRREGHRRQTHRDILREDGTFSGDYLYGLLASEYRERRA